MSDILTVMWRRYSIALRALRALRALHALHALRALLALLVACGGSEAALDAPVCQPNIVYLDRNGGSYEHGAHDNASANQSVLVDAPVALPPSPFDDVHWRPLVDCIATGLAPFPITLTEIDPGDTPHVEIVFTTSYWAGSAGTTMIVPDSCATDHAIEFVFGDALPTYARACQVTLLGLAEMRAQLSIGDNCRDIVNNSMDCDMSRAFHDQPTTCVDGANQPTPCRCGDGSTTENTYQAMAAAFTRCD